MKESIQAATSYVRSQATNLGINPKISGSEFYNIPRNNSHNVSISIVINGDVLDEVVLLDGLDGNSTHNGCRLMALDDLSMLITTGDVQDWDASQDLNELTGKTLRMSINTVDGSGGQAPSDNPIPGSLVWSCLLYTSDAADE